VGQSGGTSRDGLVAGEGADPEYTNGGGAEAACSGARSRGAAPTNQLLSLRASPNSGLCRQLVYRKKSGCLALPRIAGGFIGRSPSHIYPNVALDIRIWLFANVAVECGSPESSRHITMNDTRTDIKFKVNLSTV
jgi:hypothetical protein